MICDGTETKLSDCPLVWNTNGITSCDDKEHAGVRCEGKYVCMYDISISEYSVV